MTLNTNGAFIYTPASNFFGFDSFTYQAHDSWLNSNTATVQIRGLPPLAVDDPDGVTAAWWDFNEDAGTTATDQMAQRTATLNIIPRYLAEARPSGVENQGAA